VRDWRLIESGPAAGSRNLALDDAIFAAVLAGDAPPTLRLYAWSAPTLTIGYGQDARRDVDLAACRRRGIPVLRRVTGGRAVIHDRELTYSVAVPAGLPPFGGTLRESARAVAEVLVGALGLLGVAASAAPEAGRGPSRGKRPAACFAVASGHEVVAAGHKVVGSAQRRRPGGFLQHGSILLRGHAADLAALLRGGTAAGAGIEDLVGPRPAGEVAAALAAAAGRAWSAAFRRGGASAGEERHAAAIAVGRYGAASWNLPAPGEAPRPALTAPGAPPTMTGFERSATPCGAPAAGPPANGNGEDGGA